MARKQNPEKDVVVSSATGAAAARPRRAPMARTQRSQPAARPATPAALEPAQARTDTFVAEQELSHQEIAQVAYEMWQARGGQHGNPEEDWHRAEAELRRRKSRA